MQEPIAPAAKALDLPDNQRLALEALVAGKKRTEAAEAAGVTRQTVHRWLLAPVFLAALHQARCLAWTEVTGELHAQGLHAVRTLAAVLDCDQPRARVLAARAVLDLPARAIELENLCGRAALVEAELETRLNPAPERGPTNNNGAPTTGTPTPSATPGPAYAQGMARNATPSLPVNPFQSSAHRTGACRSCLKTGRPSAPNDGPQKTGESVTSWDMRRRSPLQGPLVTAALLASPARAAGSAATGRSA